MRFTAITDVQKWHASMSHYSQLRFRVVRCLPLVAARARCNDPQWGRRLTSLQGGNRGDAAGAR